jgi:hypothetical protein
MVPKIFTFAAGSQYQSIDSAILGTPEKFFIHECQEPGIFGTVTTNPYNYRHFGLSNFVMYGNGKKVPTEALNMNMGLEKTIMDYRTLFEGSVIHHSNSGL